MTKSVVQEFIYFKKSKGEIKNQEEFGLKIGYNSKSSFSQALSKQPLPDELITKINAVYPDFKLWIKNSVPVEIEQKKGNSFKELPLEEKMNILHEQMIEILNHNKEEMNTNRKNLQEIYSMVERIELKQEVFHQFMLTVYDEDEHKATKEFNENLKSIE